MFLHSSLSALGHSRLLNLCHDFLRYFVMPKAVKPLVPMLVDGTSSFLLNIFGCAGELHVVLPRLPAVASLSLA
eukprot:6606068-Pyramimonas_sp.AAC.1